MKVFVQIVGKCTLIFFCFYLLVSHLDQETISEMKDRFYTRLIVDEQIQLEEIRSALTSFQIEEIEQQWNTYQNIEVPVIKKQKGKIYLYNTHQSEEFMDGITIFEVTYQLAKMLKDAGFDVVFETGDFIEQMNLQNLKYNQLYTVSRQYLNDALVEYGPFDLLIDVHRDSAKRSVSVVDYDGIIYGRLMFVIGNRSSNASVVTSHSHALTDKMNHEISGIMREPFIRQSVYNQDLCENMLLLEAGTDNNTSSEVLRSLEVFVELLKREGIYEAISD